MQLQKPKNDVVNPMPCTIPIIINGYPMISPNIDIGNGLNIPAIKNNGHHLGIATINGIINGWQLSSNGGNWQPTTSLKSGKKVYLLCIDIYIYGLVFRVPTPPTPPNGMGPQVAPPSRLFASYWQYFGGPASYLLGLCSISDYQPRIY